MNPLLRYKFIHYITTMDNYEVDSYEWSTDTTLTLYIHYNITLVMMNNDVCPTHLFLISKATCLIECLILFLRCSR